MKNIAERARKAYPLYDCDGFVGIVARSEQTAYVRGAYDQKNIDIDKIKDVMNRLMLNTKDKAEVIKAMNE